MRRAVSLILAGSVLAGAVPPPASALSLLEMSEKMDRAEAGDFSGFVKKARECSDKWDFFCAEQNLGKAKRLANDRPRRDELAGAERHLASCKAAKAADERRIAEERQREEDRRRREMEELERRERLAREEAERRERRAREEREAREREEAERRAKEKQADDGSFFRGLAAVTQIGAVAYGARRYGGSPEAVNKALSQIQSVQPSSGFETSETARLQELARNSEVDFLATARKAQAERDRQAREREQAKALQEKQAQEAQRERERQAIAEEKDRKDRLERDRLARERVREKQERERQELQRRIDEKERAQMNRHASLGPLKTNFYDGPPRENAPAPPANSNLAPGNLNPPSRPPGPRIIDDSPTGPPGRNGDRGLPQFAPTTGGGGRGTPSPPSNSSYPSRTDGGGNLAPGTLAPSTRQPGGGVPPYGTPPSQGQPGPTPSAPVARGGGWDAPSNPSTPRTPSSGGGDTTPSPRSGGGGGTVPSPTSPRKPTEAPGKVAIIVTWKNPKTGLWWAGGPDQSSGTGHREEEEAIRYAKRRGNHTYVGDLDGYKVYKLDWTLGAHDLDMRKSKGIDPSVLDPNL